MADIADTIIDIEMRARNAANTGWIIEHPVTKAANVKAADGITTFQSHLAETATESKASHIQLATATEVTAGIEATKAVTSKNLKTELGKKLSITDYNPHDIDNGRYQAQFNFDGTETYIGTAFDGVLSVLLSSSNGTLTLPIGVSSGSYTDKRGITFIPQRNIIGITVAIQSACSGYTTAYIYRLSDNVLIGSTTTFSNGVGSIIANLVSGVEYYLVLDAGGSSYTQASYSTSSFPYTSTDIYVTGAYIGASGKQTISITNFLSIKVYSPSSGTVTKTYAPSDLKKWGNAKIKVLNLSANNSATATIKSSSDVQLKAPVTLVNGDNYIDILDIDSITYPVLKLVITENRNTVNDISPTVLNPSVTWEGKAKTPVQINQGSYSENTGTVTLAGSASYTKTIPLGFNAKNGRFVMAGNGWAIGKFSTVATEAICISQSTGQSIPSALIGTGTELTATGCKGIFGCGMSPYTDGIYLVSAYIQGSNLILNFKNSATSARWWELREFYWEVEG